MLTWKVVGKNNWMSALAQNRKTPKSSTPQTEKQWVQRLKAESRWHCGRIEQNGLNPRSIGFETVRVVEHVGLR